MTGEVFWAIAVGTEIRVRFTELEELERRLRDIDEREGYLGGS